MKLKKSLRTKILRTRGGFTPGPRPPINIRRIVQEGVDAGRSMASIRHQLGMNWTDSVYGAYKLAKQGVRIYHAASTALRAMTEGASSGDLAGSLKSKRGRPIGIPTIKASGAVVVYNKVMGVKPSYPKDYVSYRKLSYMSNAVDNINGAKYGQSSVMALPEGKTSDWKFMLDRPADPNVTKSTPVYLHSIKGNLLITNRDECTAHVIVTFLTAVKMHDDTLANALSSAETTEFDQTGETYNQNYPFYDVTKIVSLRQRYRRLESIEFFIQPTASVWVNYTWNVHKNLDYADLSRLKEYVSGMTIYPTIIATGFPVNAVANDAPSLAKVHLVTYHSKRYRCAFGSVKDPRFNNIINYVTEIASEKRVGLPVYTDTDGDAA